jgi:mannosyltransferase
VALTCLAAAIRFTALGSQSFWVDETETARLVSKSFPGLLDGLSRSESTPPLYYVLAWLWSQGFGVGETGLRSLSAVIGTLTVPVAYAAGSAFVSRRAGLLAAALTTVSPLLVWYSQEARAYALFVFLTAVSIVFLASALRGPSALADVGWAGSAALALLTHYFAVYLVAIEVVVLLWQRRDRSAWRAVGTVAVVGVALLPLAAYQAKYGSSSWIRSLGLTMRAQEAAGQLTVPTSPSIWGGAGVAQGAGDRWWIGLAVFAVAAGVACLLSRGRERRGVFLSLGFAAGAVGVPIVLSATSALLVGGKGDVFLYRNVIDAWLPLTIVVAAALTAARLRIAGTVLAAALLIASVAQLADDRTTGHLQRDDWRLVARHVGGSGTAMVLSPSWEVAGLQYYVRGLEPVGATARVREIDVIVRLRMPSYSIRVDAFDPPHGFARVETASLQNWTLTRFRSKTPRIVSGTALARVRPRNASQVALLLPLR